MTMQVEARRLLAIRDALIMRDVNEAYHQLRLIADPNAVLALSNGGNHWADIEAEAAADEAAHRLRG